VSKAFETKYVKGASERIERGPRETQSPYEDSTLKDYK